MITDSKGKIKPTTTTPQTNKKKEKKRKNRLIFQTPPLPKPLKYL